MLYEIARHRCRLLWIGQNREEASLEGFFAWLAERRAAIEPVCSHMGKPYRNVIARCIAQALAVLDRFPIGAKLSKAIEQGGADEARRLKKAGHQPLLEHTRCCLLKRPDNPTLRQPYRLRELLKRLLQN